MKQNVNFSTFQTAFEQLRPNNFSYEGLTALYDYLIQYEDDTGEEIDLDVIALCCDYSEMGIGDVFNSYPIECDSDEPDEAEVRQAVIDYLTDNTMLVAEIDDVVIFQNF